MLAFLTREVWDFLIFVVIIIGGVWALLRLRHDLTSPPVGEADFREAMGRRPRSSAVESEPDTTDR